MSTINRKAIRSRVHMRIRKKLAGTPERPRLAVNFSNQHVYAQVIDDTKGVTLCSACTKQVELKKANVETTAGTVAITAGSATTTLLGSSGGRLCCLCGRNFRFFSVHFL